ncbi:nitroreductase [Bacterioplanoides sp. SCSIO 12839]|uniref:nitroreductase family protein n=1 Tax=Bacterioplanoides sp. SCSIO 12839 TaxID=2829569 RepID=UPI002107BEEA|nr:nitroreductase [Bacterioplanoides sp. SCSIO 12839]UTW49774.1 nitroreductase [Bacterioplanoides sp. SCSIO 12839]
MDFLTALLERVSAPQLTGPDITNEQLEVMIQAALRAPDHAWLRPSRYIAVRGDERQQLGELFLQATDNYQELTPERQAKIRNMPMRAPLLLVAVCRIQEHPKVPREELLLSTGAGVQNILNAAWAMELGAIWRTGDLAYNHQVKEGLGLSEEEEIVGFVYVGHVNCRLKQPPELKTEDFLTSWQAKNQ